MEIVPQHPLLHFTQEDVKAAREMYDQDAKRLNEGIDAIKEWMEKQAHLAESSKYITRDFIERIILLAKGSIEVAKKKIDRLFTVRAMLPDMCLHRKLGEFDDFLKGVTLVYLPKLFPEERSRVTVTKILTDNIDNLNLIDYCRYGNMIGEYRGNHDYNIGERFIVDLSNVSIISKMNPVVIKNYDSLGEIYNFKVKGVHVVNGPQYVDTLVNLFKSVTRDKVASRIHVHKSYEDLHKYIPKEILPVDFGGDEPPLATLAEKWKELIKTPEFQEWNEMQDKLVSDESKRSSTNHNEEYLGMPGSFRKLNVD
ncbi:uncharacterized protein LOC135081995 [Ostrinia nubilalis]|uniref:uncharacterized protein LOC135081995 n=1 Tax=Ostrinia nubilalis TaxID=29057 RepID=UPI0030822100